VGQLDDGEAQSLGGDAGPYRCGRASAAEGAALGGRSAGERCDAVVAGKERGVAHASKSRL